MIEREKIIRTLILIVFFYCSFNYPTQAQSLPSESLESEEILTEQITTIEILGNTVFSDSEIKQLFVEFKNQSLSFADLLLIAQRITDLYQQNGYVTSEAILPPQTIDDGVVKIEIKEGKLEKTLVEGRKNLNEKLILSYFPTPGSVLNTKDLIENLRKLERQVSLKRIDAKLTEGSEDNDLILILAIQEESPFELFLETNNYRSFRIGTTQGIIDLAYSNIIGIGDRIFAEYNFTEGFDAYNVGFSLPITITKGNFEFNYREGDSEIILDVLRDADIRARVETFLVQYRQEIVDKNKRTINLGVGFRRSKNNTSLLGQPFSFSPGVQEGRAVTSVVSLTGDWVERNPTSALVSRVELAFGIDAFDATVNGGDTPDAIFTVLRFDTQWTKALNRDRNLLLLLRFFGQFSPDTLLVTEQFSIGGVDTVRGTERNQVFGDNGVGWNLGFYIPLWRSEQNEQRVLTLNPFFDGAGVWNNKDINNLDNSSFLMSVGVGLIFQISEKSNIRLIYGVPIVNENEQDDKTLQGNGFTFSLSWGL